MKSFLKVIGLIVGVCALVARPEMGYAQQAAIVGAVLDDSRAVLPGVVVVATSQDTGPAVYDSQRRAW